MLSWFCFDLFFSPRGLFLKSNSVLEPTNWVELVNMVLSSGQVSVNQRDCVSGADLHDLTSYSIMHCVFPFLYYDLFVLLLSLLILIHVHFFSCTCALLAVFASVIPRLQHSQDMRSLLADEHALIASYVARLQHCTRLVSRAAAAGALPRLL